MILGGESRKKEGLGAEYWSHPNDKSPTLLRSKRVGDLCQFGSAGRIRTYDQVVNSHPLCQLSYRGMNKYINEKPGKNQMRPRRQRPYISPFFTPQQWTINPRSTP